MNRTQAPLHPSSPTPLAFLKLGGSMITDKNTPSTARLDVLRQAIDEIAAARQENPQLQMVLGHGSGSFGHFPAKKYNTRAGVHSQAEWAGFIEVWQQAAALNHLVMEALASAQVPAMAFPPSACASADDGKLALWETAPLQAALAAGVIPVVFGDVVFDTVRGGTIASTEDVFSYLAPRLQPTHILLAGDEPGVFADYQAHDQIIPMITPRSEAVSTSPALAHDVTGGMQGKVDSMLALVQGLPGCQVRIFSGLEAGNIQAALDGRAVGTLIKAQ